MSTLKGKKLKIINHKLKNRKISTLTENQISLKSETIVDVSRN